MAQMQDPKTFFGNSLEGLLKVELKEAASFGIHGNPLAHSCTFHEACEQLSQGVALSSGNFALYSWADSF